MVVYSNPMVEGARDHFGTTRAINPTHLGYFQILESWFTLDHIQSLKTQRYEFVLRILEVINHTCNCQGSNFFSMDFSTWLFELLCDMGTRF